MKTIQINDYKIIVDDDDYQKLIKYKWYIIKSNSEKHIYAYTRINKKTILMHRIVMNFPEGLQIDHINHNGLDNRKENLRVVTCRKNAHNRVNQAKYIGVRKDGNKYAAAVSFMGKTITIAYCETPLEAQYEYETAIDFIEHVDDVINENYHINNFIEEDVNFL